MKEVKELANIKMWLFNKAIRLKYVYLMCIILKYFSTLSLTWEISEKIIYPIVTQ